MARHRMLLGALAAGAAILASARLAAAQPAPAAPCDPAGVEAIEQIHAESIHTRRLLADAVLAAGLFSLAGGGALIVPAGDDRAWRFAGVNTAIFGAVNTVVGLLARSGIAREERTWESVEARAARRTPQGLIRARMHAVIDERRESAAHAVNLGLGCAYLGIAGTVVLASQLGVEHPDRWLASGAAIGVQALFLVAVDSIGLWRSGHYHGRLVEGLAPTVSVLPAPSGMETRVGVGATF